MKDTIFIQIASYRDPELPKTINDLLCNAKNPQNLRLGICRQYHPDDKFDTLDEYREDSRFKIIDVKYDETGGVCWARNKIQQLYNGEKYTLQLDSHHRFVKDWDEVLIKMLTDLQSDGYEKPLITAYLPSYEPHNDPAGRAPDPWKLAFDRFIPEGAIFFKPEVVDNWKERDRAVPGRFYSAHFAFTVGEFCNEVQHNPEYLFHGEEISIAARAYTWGYDIFHPHRMVAWHEYTRSYRKQVWGDDPEWNRKNVISHTINRKLLGVDGIEQEGHDHPKYGFGPKRTLRDYEKFVGLHFATRGVQEETLKNTYPPNPTYESDEEWLASFTSVYKHCIDVHKTQFDRKDYEFWVVALHSGDDDTVYRKDLTPKEIENLLETNSPVCNIWVEFNAKKLPKYWVVWPYSAESGWCDRITGDL